MRRLMMFAVGATLVLSTVQAEAKTVVRSKARASLNDTWAARYFRIMLPGSRHVTPRTPVTVPSSSKRAPTRATPSGTSLRDPAAVRAERQLLDLRLRVLLGYPGPHERIPSLVPPPGRW